MRCGKVTELVVQCQELVAELAMPAESEFDRQIAGSLGADGKLTGLAATKGCVGIAAGSLAHLQVEDVGDRDR
jgi:hypothetical protein